MANLICATSIHENKISFRTLVGVLGKKHDRNHHKQQNHARPILGGCGPADVLRADGFLSSQGGYPSCRRLYDEQFHRYLSGGQDIPTLQGGVRVHTHSYLRLDGLEGKLSSIHDPSLSPPASHLNQRHDALGGVLQSSHAFPFINNRRFAITLQGGPPSL